VKPDFRQADSSYPYRQDASDPCAGVLRGLRVVASWQRHQFRGTRDGKFSIVAEDRQTGPPGPSDVQAGTSAVGRTRRFPSVRFPSAPRWSRIRTRKRFL